MVIFAQLGLDDTTTYLVDAGFGGAGLARPILLSDDPKNVVHGTSSTELHRLIKSGLPTSGLGTHLAVLRFFIY